MSHVCMVGKRRPVATGVIISAIKGLKLLRSICDGYPAFV